MMPTMKTCSLCGGVFAMTEAGYLQCIKCSKQIVPEAYHEPDTKIGIRIGEGITQDVDYPKVDLIKRIQELENHCRRLQDDKTKVYGWLDQANFRKNEYLARAEKAEKLVTELREYLESQHRDNITAANIAYADCENWDEHEVHGCPVCDAIKGV